MIKFLSLLALFCSCSLLGKSQSFHYEQSMISSGNNYPDFNLYRDSLDRLIVSLHERIGRNDFCRQYGWSEEHYDSAIHFLMEEGFVKQTDRYYPTCMVMNDRDGKWFYRIAERLSQQVADSVEAVAKNYADSFTKTHLSHQLSFDSASFFLLSDVLLDNWQINNIEQLYLKSPRPLRNDKRYYYRFSENTDNNREAFGIYGNQYYQGFAVYGNNRLNINPALMQKQLSQLPVIDSVDDAVFNRWALQFSKRLVSLLQHNDAYIHQQYQQSVYAHEITFEEFFIWWYHFIYTRATDLLHDRNLLSYPAGDNFFYINKA